MKLDRKIVLSLLTPLLFLAACSSETQKQNKVVYLDDSEVITDVFDIKVKSVTANKMYNSENYDFTLNLNVKNISKQTQSVVFENIVLAKEQDNMAYTMKNSPRDSLDSGIERTFSFYSTIPTSLVEHYYFSFDLPGINYKVLLYETPDETRKDLTVTYVVDDKVVNTETVKKGRTRSNYVYDTPDHQKHSSSWKDSSGKTYSVIEEDITLYATMADNFDVMTTSSDKYSFVNKVKYVPADGKVVIADKYLNKEPCLSNSCIYNNKDIKEVYIPKTLRNIYNGNFSSCSNLKTIYYAGTQSEWDAIPKSSVTIPSNVNIVYNTAFTY